MIKDTIDDRHKMEDDKRGPQNPGVTNTRLVFRRKT